MTRAPLALRVRERWEDGTPPRTTVVKFFPTSPSDHSSLEHALAMGPSVGPAAHPAARLRAGDVGGVRYAAAAQLP